MSELNNCEIETLRQDSEFVVSRVERRNGLPPLLLVEPTLERPAAASLAQLKQAYALREELDHTWATRPVEMVRHQGKVALLLHDPGGVFLESLLGQPMELISGLRMAIGIAATLDRFHARD